MNKILSINLFSNLYHDVFKVDTGMHFQFISCIFLLLPITLITGPFLPDLFLSVIGFYFLVLSLVKREFNLYKNKFILIFALFIFYLIVRGIFSEYPYESLIKYNGPIFYFRYLFFVLGVQFLISQNPKLIKLFCISLVLVITFSVLDGYLQWMTGQNIFGFKSPSIRVTGIFNDEEILGHFLSHVVPLAFSLLIFTYGTSHKKIILYMFFLIISEVMIFITNDRAGFLKIFQFTFILVFLSTHFKIYRLIAFTISAIIIFLILNFSSNSQSRYSDTLSDVSSTYIPYMPWTPAHERHFSVAIDMFKENPIFGQGPQMFKTLCQIIPKYVKDCTSHPHNYWFQTLGELGTVGVFFLLIALIHVSFLLIKHLIGILNKNKTFILPDHVLSLYALIFIFLWPLIPHQSFYNNWLNVLVYLPVGFLLYFKNK